MKDRKVTPIGPLDAHWDGHRWWVEMPVVGSICLTHAEFKQSFVEAEAPDDSQ